MRSLTKLQCCETLSTPHSQCDAVQNLRKAILDYRASFLRAIISQVVTEETGMRAESAPPGRSQDRLREVAKSYLFRQSIPVALYIAWVDGMSGYGLLIAFAGSLLDKADAADDEASLSFPDWLRRREIPRLLARESASRSLCLTSTSS